MSGLSAAGRGKADAFDVRTKKLLAALSECTECGQVFILSLWPSTRPDDEREAESIIDRVLQRLQHANIAVVLSSTKVILSNLRSHTFDMVCDTSRSSLLSIVLAY